MLAFLAEAYSVAYGLVNSMIIRLAYPAGACLLYLLPELLLPRTRNSLRSYRRAVVFLVVAIAINTVVLKAMEGSAGFFDVKPLAFLDLRPLTESPSLPLRITGWLMAALGIAMVGNFFYYWMHRAQHRFGWMWRNYGCGRAFLS